MALTPNKGIKGKVKIDWGDIPGWLGFVFGIISLVCLHFFESKYREIEERFRDPRFECWVERIERKGTEPRLVLHLRNEEPDKPMKYVNGDLYPVVPDTGEFKRSIGFWLDNENDFCPLNEGITRAYKRYPMLLQGIKNFRGEVRFINRGGETRTKQLPRIEIKTINK